MNCLKAEKNVGIEVFFSPSKGIGGKLRENFEDFIVEEVSVYPEKKENGKFIIAEVRATNWETNLLVREISNRLHISKKRISFAGTKDRRAKTTRLMSFFNINIDDINNIKIKDVEINKPYYSDKPVNIGGLLGNRFKLIVRDLDNDITLDDVNKNIDFISDKGGFPNFFGIQRFGIIRPITHVVGKYIILDDFEKALMTYVANPCEGESNETFNIRKNLEKTRDYKNALMNFPNYLKFEKALLNKLVEDPNNFIDAFKELPMNLLTMFIYAYQSFLFNKILSERIRKDIPIDEAIVGDVILPFRKGFIKDEHISVTERNLEKVNKQIKKGKAFVGGLLFGFDSHFSAGEMGEIEHKIIENEKIEAGDFIIPEITRLSSSGLRRSLIAPIKKLDYNLEKNKDNQEILLRIGFELLKGSYATSFLRELMKTDDIRNY